MNNVILLAVPVYPPCVFTECKPSLSAYIILFICIIILVYSLIPIIRVIYRYYFNKDKTK